MLDCRPLAVGRRFAWSPCAGRTRPRPDKAKSRWPVPNKGQDWRGGSESSVDDLGARQSVVLQKAFSTMRSVETLLSLGGFVLSAGRDLRGSCV